MALEQKHVESELTKISVRCQFGVITYVVGNCERLNSVGPVGAYVVVTTL